MVNKTHGVVEVPKPAPVVETKQEEKAEVVEERPKTSGKGRGSRKPQKQHTPVQEKEVKEEEKEVKPAEEEPVKKQEPEPVAKNEEVEQDEESDDEKEAKYGQFKPRKQYVDDDGFMVVDTKKKHEQDMHYGRGKYRQGRYQKGAYNQRGRGSRGNNNGGRGRGGEGRGDGRGRGRGRGDMERKQSFKGRGSARKEEGVVPANEGGETQE